MRSTAAGSSLSCWTSTRRWSMPRRSSALSVSTCPSSCSRPRKRGSPFGSRMSRGTAMSESASIAMGKVRRTRSAGEDTAPQRIVAIVVLGLLLPGDAARGPGTACPILGFFCNPLRPMSEYAKLRREWAETVLGPHEAREPPRTRLPALAGHLDPAPLYGPDDLEEAGFDPVRELGVPGSPPFTRGVYPNMHRGRL